MEVRIFGYDRTSVYRLRRPHPRFLDLTGLSGEPEGKYELIMLS